MLGHTVRAERGLQRKIDDGEEGWIDGEASREKEAIRARFYDARETVVEDAKPARARTPIQLAYTREQTSGRRYAAW